MLGTVARLVHKTWAKWSYDDGWIYAAAMASFAALALAPLLVITLRIAEAIGGRSMVVHGLAQILTPFVGHGGVRSIDAVAGNAREANNSALATAVSALIALFAGSRLFYAMQRALHVMWGTPIARNASLAATALSFVAAAVLSVLVVAALTLVIFGTAMVSVFVHGAGAQGLVAATWIRVGASLVGAALLTPVVAALFKWLPGAGLTWGDVWIGALTTTIGFALAQFAIGFYLAEVNLPWTYGSASSLVVVLLWLYYSSYLYLLGAEFTYVYAHELGSMRTTPP